MDIIGLAVERTGGLVYAGFADTDAEGFFLFFFLLFLLSRVWYRVLITLVSHFEGSTNRVLAVSLYFVNCRRYRRSSEMS